MRIVHTRTNQNQNQKLYSGLKRVRLQATLPTRRATFHYKDGSIAQSQALIDIGAPIEEFVHQWKRIAVLDGDVVESTIVNAHSHRAILLVRDSTIVSEGGTNERTEHDGTVYRLDEDHTHEKTSDCESVFVYAQCACVCCV